MGRSHVRWNVRRAQIHCLTCGHEAWLDGFTLSEFEPIKLLTAAIVDMAMRRPCCLSTRDREHTTLSDWLPGPTGFVLRKAISPSERRCTSQETGPARHHWCDLIGVCLAVRLRCRPSSARPGHLA